MDVQIISYLLEEGRWIAMSLYPLPIRQKRHPNHFEVPVTEFPTTHTYALGDTREEAVQNLSATIGKLFSQLPNCESGILQFKEKR